MEIRTCPNITQFLLQGDKKTRFDIENKWLKNHVLKAVLIAEDGWDGVLYAIHGQKLVVLNLVLANVLNGGIAQLVEPWKLWVRSPLPPTI